MITSVFSQVDVIDNTNTIDTDTIENTIDTIDNSDTTITIIDNNDNNNNNNNSNDIIVDNDITIPPMYVLNLDRSKERWLTQEAEMKKAGLTVNRFPAVDGKELSDEELMIESNRMAMFLQPRGVIGCYLSHKRFWQMVVDKDLDYAIIFEDDVELVSDFKRKLEDNWKNLNHQIKSTFDVLMLGAIGMVHPEGKDGLGLHLFSAYIGGKRKRIHLTENVIQPSRPAGTHAYMVSNKGARKLLELCKRATFHVDLDAWRHPDLNLYMFNPMLAFQTFAHTSLTEIEPAKNRYRGPRRIIFDFISNTRLMKKIDEWAIEPYTHQPWSHVFGEPMLQIAGGPVLTVQRHFVIVTTGVVTSTILHQFGLKQMAKVAFSSTVTFIVAVRGLIYLLMNWK